MPAARHPHRIGRRVLRRLAEHRRALFEKRRKQDKRRQQDADEAFAISFEEAYAHRQSVL